MTKIGIVSALRAEATCLTGKKALPAGVYQLDEKLWLALSGMGEREVNTALERLLSRGVEGVISFGTAGALRGGVYSGDIILPARIIAADGNALALASSWRERARQQLAACPATVHHADLASINTVITSAHDKHALQRDTGAIAVDMESALVTAFAREHGLAALAIRVIVDEAGRAIPAEILPAIDAYGEVAILALLGKIILHPRLIRDLAYLDRAFRAASRSMRWLGRHAAPVFLPE